MTETRGNQPGARPDSSLDEAWQEFRERLASYLDLMDDDADHLLVEVPQPEDGAAPFAQVCAIDDGHGLLAELAGNQVLAPAFRAGPAGAHRLLEFGWQGGADDEHPNWSLRRPRTAAADMAVQIVVGLREVFAIAHPQLLTYRAWGPAAAFADMLGLQPRSEVPSDLVVQPPVPAVLFPDGRAELVEYVRDTLRRHLHDEPTQDDDQDFVLTHMGQPVWVRVHLQQPAVEIFARVGHDVYSRRHTAVEIGLLNRDRAWVRWVLRERDVWQQLMIPAKPFAPAVLDAMITVFVDAMTETRDDLALRTGAKVA